MPDENIMLYAQWLENGNDNSNNVIIDNSTGTLLPRTGEFSMLITSCFNDVNWGCFLFSDY
ncbi:hypothetical protein AZF37_01010 [endosymbiont 'TC1' of Trimyema compressum]|nr:hypothetical protein AZF37_01010 [endosymbiont 'TC1' of Trimyema compressum]